MSEIKKADLKSMSIPEDKLRQLKQAFPEAFTEGFKVDLDKLRFALGENIEVGRERFGMNWPGKGDCFKIIQAPSVATLVPAKDESVNFDTTENLFIEGDNLEVLKLLQKSYYGKIKMIYIDPPYNTGGDFIYPDNYAESLDTYLRYSGQIDNEGRKYSTNAETDGRFHSKWLNMIYPRLYLAKSLLKDEGVIFISIDDNEVSNLRKLCDEIFGEENFVECITWNKRIPKNDKGIGNIHEYILVYVKNSVIKQQFTMPKEGLEDIDILLKKLKNANVPIPEAENEIRKLYNKKGYDRGITLYNSLDKNYELWGKINVSWPNGETTGPNYAVLHPITKRPVKVPERGWRWKKESFEELLDYTNTVKLQDGSYICGQIWFDKGETTQPSLVKYLKDVETLLLRSIISLKSDGGLEVEDLFGGKNIMSYPKPTDLIKTLVDSLQDSSNNIVLDFFAGSATTAQAVLDLNNEDGGDRKFICVQLPESCANDSEAFKAGYKTIAEIGKERIRRAIKKIQKEQTQSTAEEKLLFDNAKRVKTQDIGFKVFKLVQSNFKLWEGSVEPNKDAVEKQLEMHIEHINPKSSQDDILFELLLKAGFELTTKIEKVSMGGKTVYSIEGGLMLICLEKELTQEVIKAMAEKGPSRVICLDQGFVGNDQLKTNAVQIMKSKGVEDFRTV